MQTTPSRSRWAAIGAAIAITLGAGGIGVTQALTESGEKAIYSPIEPCRLVDTRPPPDRVGPRVVPLGADETYTLSGWDDVGGCALPSDTTALSLNVTAVNATQPTFITLYPADAPARPLASNLNPVPGAPPTPNAVTVGLDATGGFDIYNKQGSVDIIIDVVGVYEDHNHDDRYYTKAEVDAMTSAASATRTITLPLESDNQEVLSAEITTVDSSSLVVVAAIEANGDGGDDDNMNCNFDVDGVIGLRQSITIPQGVSGSSEGVLTMTQVFPVTAGTHTITVVCNKAPESGTSVESASLVALATS